jgi:hypothetical protein
MQVRFLISGVRLISFTNDYSASYRQYKKGGVQQPVKGQHHANKPYFNSDKTINMAKFKYKL